MKKLLYITLAMLTAASCSKQGDMVDAAYDGEVRISSSIATRTTGNMWESGDAIGLYMGSGSTYLGENAKYVTTGSGDFIADAPLYFPATGAVDFMAYYPYVDGVDPEAYAVDVTNQIPQGAIDLLTANVTNVEYSATPLGMTFDHKLSRVEFAFETGKGVEWAELAGIEVVLSGAIAEGTYNLKDRAVTLGSESADITMSTTASGSRAEAIILPQNLSGAKLSVKLSDDRCFVTGLKDQRFESGNEYKYRVTLDSEMQISSASITAWGVGNDEGEDLFTVHDIVEVDGVWQIYSGAGLREFATKVNGGSTTINGKLMNDIDLGGVDQFTPIGNSSNKYAGTFDGGGHLVSGLKVSEATYAGLFGYIGANGLVINVGVSGSVGGSSSEKAGGVVAYNYGKVINCYSSASADIYSGLGCGGVVGYNQESGTVKNCYTSTAMLAVGYNNNGTVKNCYYQGNGAESDGQTPMSQTAIQNATFATTLTSNARSYNNDATTKACGWKAVSGNYPVLDPTSYPVTAN